ncbi:MAG: S-methyl-5'-thioadenosine phosphorylase [Nanoarchaeota archaeon]|nr:S-methyl-5'-thioadenosine phosphorylase [Nanoarchaeota archaeon]
MKIGIIGGSGLEDPNILKDAKEIEVNTPFGKPSSKLIIGKINDVDVVIISRHGKKHDITPTNVPNRANITALKEAGCTHIITTTACGSLKKEIGRGHFVILDQFIDFTRRRDVTIFDKFENGPVELNHTPMAEPFDEKLRKALYETAKSLKLDVHKKGTVVTIEGPRFSTKAESKMFSILGADVINMSIAPECIIANELNIPYAAVAMATDYDCLFDDVAPVTWEEVLKVFKKNADKVTKLIINTIPKIEEAEK